MSLSQSRPPAKPKKTISEKVASFRERLGRTRAVRAGVRARHSIVRAADDIETRRLQRQSERVESLRNQTRALRSERSLLREQRLLRTEKEKLGGSGGGFGFGQVFNPDFSGLPGTQDLDLPGMPSRPKPKTRRKTTAKKKKR